MRTARVINYFPLWDIRIHIYILRAPSCGSFRQTTDHHFYLCERVYTPSTIYFRVPRQEKSIRGGEPPTFRAALHVDIDDNVVKSAAALILYVCVCVCIYTQLITIYSIIVLLYIYGKECVLTLFFNIDLWRARAQVKGKVSLPINVLLSSHSLPLVYICAFQQYINLKLLCFFAPNRSSDEYTSISTMRA